MAIITISRGSLSGGELLAEQLSARLGSEVISREVIVEAARKYGVSETKLREGMKGTLGFWDRFRKQKERYILAVQATLAEMVKEGNIIYHGHAGHLLLKELSRVIKVRLIAPMEYRIRSAMIELNLSREKAVKHIETVDERRAKWVKQLFNVEWTDPDLYDLVLNLEHMSIETASELVVDLAGRREYRRNPELERERHAFALRKRVMAELAFRTGFPEDSINVSLKQGSVFIKSSPFFDKNREEVIGFISRIEGIEAVLTEGGDTAEKKATAVSQERKAADIMLPVSSYPFIHHTVTIREAIAALSTSSVQLNDGHVISPRFILVQDETHKLVGVIARRSLLRGLNPTLKAMERAKETVEAVTHRHDLSWPMAFSWVSLFSEAAVAYANEPVSAIMAPIRATVRPEDNLSEVVTTMLQVGVDLVPVVDGNKPVGVILMTDVFDTVAEFIMENAKED
jgi:cytidylate kinase/CBS domain-containing protein